jgi:hypothetical protein
MVIDFDQMTSWMQGKAPIIGAYQNGFPPWGSMNRKYGGKFVPVAIVFPQHVGDRDFLSFGNGKGCDKKQ